MKNEIHDYMGNAVHRETSRWLDTCTESKVLRIVSPGFSPEQFLKVIIEWWIIE